MWVLRIQDVRNDPTHPFLVFRSDLIAFEKAYCEYRLNRIENALKTIQAASQQTDKLKELYGQVVIMTTALATRPLLLTRVLVCSFSNCSHLCLSCIG